MMLQAADIDSSARLAGDRLAEFPGTRPGPLRSRQGAAVVRPRLGRKLALAVLIPVANAFLALTCGHAVVAQNRLDSHIRDTKPLSPEEQLQRFRVPEGFEVQLVAAEPDIQKPMNLAFDTRGRLWVSGSVEYPFAAPDGQGRDSIRILEDHDGNGRADRIQLFAEGLNIPIGLYPYRNGVIAYSIPNISYYRDDDGDGRADHEQVLYGPLGNPVDTHGLQNAFRRGLDGWLYVCHGFRNTSVIEGRDGSRIELESGNTYRIRLDGSRVEQFTWGQVNPFGSDLTSWGDWITADCHSTPLTMLIRGGYYSSFGKPDDGLGFVPPIMQHGHGSTGLAGVAIQTGSQWPEAYRQSVFLGNVITSRVHHDKLLLDGSTIQAVEQPDFVTCDDPWFRPVDLRFGPDGALYIADFYNRIIGHYEVPLDHPLRDRHRGRIWRVVYRGEATASPDLEQASLDELVLALGDPQLPRRMLAMDQLSDRMGVEEAPRVRKALHETDSAEVRIHAAWVLYRWGALEQDDLTLLAENAEPMVRVHVMRMLAETSAWTAQHRSLAQSGLEDPEPLVRRAAAGALGEQPRFDQVDLLLGALQQLDPGDHHLRHAVRIALKQHLLRPEILAQLRVAELSEDALLAVARVALAVPRREASHLLVAAAERNQFSDAELPTVLKHVALHCDPQLVSDFVSLIRRRAAHDIDLQIASILAVAQQVDQLSANSRAAVVQWAETLIDQQMAARANSQPAWFQVAGETAWDLETRVDSEGRESVFLSSFPVGEQATGRLRSAEFLLPDRLSFDICGHRGPPGQRALDGNRLELRLADGQLIRSASPPRSDRARRIVWEAGEHAGQPAYLELVDELALNSYAWLGIANIEPDVVAIPETGPRTVQRRRQAAFDLIRIFQLVSYRDQLREILTGDPNDPAIERAAAGVLAHLNQLPLAEALTLCLARPGVSAELRDQIKAAVLGTVPGEEVLHKAMQQLPLRLQQQLALLLVQSNRGAAELLRLAEQGVASARLLQTPRMQQLLLASNIPDAQDRIQRVVDQLPPLKTQTEATLASRRRGFQTAERSAARGLAAFTKHCAACHRVGDTGSIVGPQLDGIGNRGLERLLEDVLDPNRNLDAAFHTAVVALADGRVLTGLFRRQEGGTLIFAGNDGKEFRVPADLIDQQRITATSIMPDNWATQLGEQEFYDLLEYLLALRAPDSPQR